jgi:hypothetical protein
MDDTQRNILGGALGGGAAIAGVILGFTVGAVAGVVVGLAGVGLVLIAWRPGQKSANPETSAEPAVVEVVEVAEMPPSETDRRQKLRARLDHLYQEGQKVLGMPVELIDFRKVSMDWTSDTYEFLGRSLGPESANGFYYQWSPTQDDGSVATARTAHGARLQVLGTIIERSGGLPMRGDWKP